MIRRPKNRVYLTNNSSILSKYSAVKAGYFTDPQLRLLVEYGFQIRNRWSRSTLVNRGYAARILAIDGVVQSTISSEAIDCVIVLGAGYDTLALRNLDKPCAWIEVDFDIVVQEKLHYICDLDMIKDAKSKLSRDYEAGLFSFSESQYHFISQDMRETSRLGENLSLILNKIPSKKNVLILNEVCLSYLEMPEVEQILETVISTLQEQDTHKVHYVGYEPFKPEGGKFGTMVSNMDSHFSKHHYRLKYFPTSSDIQALLKERLNFNHLTISPMHHIFYKTLFKKTLQIAAFQKDIFDEYEELDLYLSHYALVTGVLHLENSFLGSHDTRVPPTESRDEKKEASNGRLRVEELNLSRYGHASCVLEDTLDGNNPKDLFFVTGGFGTRDNPINHRRLDDCRVIVSTENEGQLAMAPVRSRIEEVCLDRMHGQVKAIGGHDEGKLLFFNGGRQSPVYHDKSNVAFTAVLTESRELKLHHAFEFGKMLWRHKLTELQDGQRLYQVGGIRQSGDLYEPIVEWRFDASRLGHFPVMGSREDVADHFRRHSFGMDMQQSNVMLLLGGLFAGDSRFIQLPIERQAIIFDLRSNVPSFPELKCDHCYGANVHFVNEHQFVQIGGISTKSGQSHFETGGVELVDLRNRETVERFHLISEQSSKIMLTNATSCHLKTSGEIYSLGGGGNFFTFGTHLNKHSICYKHPI